MLKVKEVLIKKFYLLVLVIMCLSCTSCTYLVNQNQNANTQLDKAVITYDVMVNWYTGIYDTVFKLNVNPHLPSEAKHILINEINPAMDGYKGVLLSYGDLIEEVQNHVVITDSDIYNLESNENILNGLKNNIINIMLLVEKN